MDEGMTKYGVVVEKKPLCSICGQELDTSTTPPTCPKCGTRGIEKRSEEEKPEKAFVDDLLGIEKGKP